MKLCKSNVFVNKIFVKDQASDLDMFSYDVDHPEPNLKSVIVSHYPQIREIRVLDVNYQVAIKPFKFENEKQFNSLALGTLISACSISNNISNSIYSAYNQFSINDIPIGYVLVSKDFVFTPQIESDLYHNFNIHKDKVIRVSGSRGYVLKNNEMLFTPENDHLGVVAINGDNLDQYAIAIMNAQGPYLVEL